MINFPVQILWDSSGLCEKLTAAEEVLAWQVLSWRAARLPFSILWSPPWWQPSKSQLPCKVQLPFFPAEHAIHGRWWTFSPPRLSRVFHRVFQSVKMWLLASRGRMEEQRVTILLWWYPFLYWDSPKHSMLSNHCASVGAAVVVSCAGWRRQWLMFL